MSTTFDSRLSLRTCAVAAALGMFVLAGCNRRDSLNETAQDVAAEQRAAADVATDGWEDRAAAEYDVAVAQADGQRNVAREKCETLAGEAQKACKSQADATYEAAKAQANYL